MTQKYLVLTATGSELHTPKGSTSTQCKLKLYNILCNLKPKSRLNDGILNFPTCNTVSGIDGGSFIYSENSEHITSVEPNVQSHCQAQTDAEPRKTK